MQKRFGFKIYDLRFKIGREGDVFVYFGKEEVYFKFWILNFKLKIKVCIY